MSLGGSGFAAGYTPIRFAPLVSLTGPIQGATPTAPEAPAAPMIRPPVYQGDAGDYGGMPATYYGGPPINERSRGALQADMANAAGFFMNPLGMMAAYALTGQTPAMQFGIGNQREALGLGPSDAMPQGLMPQGGMSGMFGGLRDFLFGPQQESVPLGDMRAPLSAGGEGMSGAVFGDAEAIARSMGLGDERSAEIGRTAMGLLSQGLDPVSAVTLATNYGAYATRPDAGVAMQGAAAQGMPGLSRNAFDLTAPAAAAPAQTFAIGDTGGSSIGDSGSYGGGMAGETGAPGEASFGLDR
jgi:hypothetical protein